MEFLAGQTATKLLDKTAELVSPIYDIYQHCRTSGFSFRSPRTRPLDEHVRACIHWEAFAIYGAPLFSSMADSIRDTVDCLEEREEWQLAETWALGTIHIAAEWFCRNTPLQRSADQLRADVLRYFGPEKFLDAIMKEAPVKLAEAFDPAFLKDGKRFKEFESDLMLYLCTGQTSFQSETGWTDEILRDGISFEDDETEQNPG